MHDDENLDKFLEEGEIVRWSAAPQPYKLFDETHKTSTIISLCWALAWGIILIGGYYYTCASQGHEIKTGVMVFCSAIPVMLAWSPAADRNNVRKLTYAITDRKVIVVSSEAEKACTMSISDIDGLLVEKTYNGNCHVRVGSPVFKASARKLPGLAFRGEFDNIDSNKIFKGLVFYNVSAEDGTAICNLLKPLVEVGR